MPKKKEEATKEEAAKTKKPTEKQLAAEAAEKQLQETMDMIQTKFGEGSIIKLGESPKVDIDAISTGSIGLDSALGIGGIPRGRIIEIYGPESSGKTTLTLHIIAEAQKKGGVCAFIDAGSSACSASMNAHTPPFFCASAMMCRVRVVFPDDSGP